LLALSLYGQQTSSAIEAAESPPDCCRPGTAGCEAILQRTNKERKWFFNRSYATYNRLKLEIMICFGCGILGFSAFLKTPVEWIEAITFTIPVALILFFEPYRLMVLGATMVVVAGRAVFSAVITNSATATSLALISGLLLR
jgi:hypothetical protein